MRANWACLFAAGLLLLLGVGCDDSGVEVAQDVGTEDVAGDGVVPPGDLAGEDSAEDEVPQLDSVVPLGYAVHEWGVVSSGRVQTAPTTYLSLEDKPILYFYSDHEFTVDVQVEIRNGTARETWPQVELGSVLSWPGLVVEAGACTQHTPFPIMGQGQCANQYEEPCEAFELANYIVSDASCLRFGEVSSPMLFYAGDLSQPWVPVTGTFVPVRNRSMNAVQATLTLTEEFARDLIVVYRNIEAEEVEFSTPQTTAAKMGVNAAMLSVRVGNVVSAQVGWDVVEDDPEQAGFGPAPQFETGVTALRAELLGLGLNEEEAEAFVTAWKGVFFGVDVIEGVPGVAVGESLCVIGFHSQATYDQLMPLTLDPVPTKTTRVLVSYTCI